MSYAILSVRGPLVGNQFDTFEQFHTALDDLKRNGYHLLRVHHSQSAEDYNKQRKRR